MSLVLRNGLVLSGGILHRDTDLRIEGDKVTQLGRALVAEGAPVIDAAGYIVAPGFIDLHIHGAAGMLCEDADTASIHKLSALLPRYGVTAFLPTLAALPPAQLRAAVAAIAAARGHEPGARIIGIHLEGPFLNPKVAGAQDTTCMRAPSLTELDELQAIAGGCIRLLTLAPELPGALPFIAGARQRGIAVSMGHSAATAEQTRQAVAAGATHVTHLYNAMRPFHHREPGIIGVALNDDGLSVELIADGHHVAADAVALAWRSKPRHKFVLVSDAVALGMEDGSYEMFGTTCLVGGGTIRLAAGGALAGSTLNLAQGVRNLRQWLPREPLAELLASASRNAAAVIGEAGIGDLVSGGPADAVVLDANLEVQLTICRGAVVLSRA